MKYFCLGFLFLVFISTNILAESYILEFQSTEETYVTDWELDLEAEEGWAISDADESMLSFSRKFEIKELPFRWKSKIRSLLIEITEDGKVIIDNYFSDGDYNYVAQSQLPVRNKKIVFIAEQPEYNFSGKYEELPAGIWIF